MSNISDIVTMVVEALCGLHLLTHEDIPYFVYGHEFGALVAFEICRRVQEEFPVKALFVSSMSCPQVGVSVHCFPLMLTCGGGTLQAGRHGGFYSVCGFYFHYSVPGVRNTNHLRQLSGLYKSYVDADVRAVYFLRQRWCTGCLTTHVIFSPRCVHTDGPRARENVVSLPSFSKRRDSAQKKC